MDIKEKMTCFERPFGCFKIEWGIENYFIETSKKKWSLYSPVFNVRGNQITKWRLNFRGTCMKGESFASVYLERSELDSFPHKVRVNWRLFYPWASPNRHMSESTFIFNQKSSFGKAVYDFERLDLYNYLYSTTTFSNTFKIQCFMIVYDGERKAYQSLDTGLKTLSQDLAVAYRLEDQCDLLMNSDGLTIGAHKALLFSRVKKLREELDIDTFEINLPDLDVEATKKIIAYLYTANLDYVLRIPSFQIRDCIAYLEIKELESYYKYDELHVCTEIGVHEHCFDWVINDIKAKEESCVTSNILKINKNNLTFRLHLYKEGFNGTSDYMSIFMEKLEGDWPDNFCVEFSITDPFGFRHLQQRLRWTSDEGSEQGIENFVLRNIMDSDTILWLGSLQIVCKICFSTSSESISKVKTKVQSIPNVNSAHHYEVLSNDMANLFKKEMFSDFTILCGETEFHVHKFLMSARSYKFKSKLKNVDCISIEGVEPEVFRKVISYMYSGRLKKYELPDIFKIYAAADKFFMLPLKYACTDILRGYIETMNLEKVLSLADRGKDFKLNLAAFKYICKNLNEVIEKLRYSKTYNEDLRKECFKFVNCYATLNRGGKFSN